MHAEIFWTVASFESTFKGSASGDMLNHVFNNFTQKKAEEKNKQNTHKKLLFLREKKEKKTRFVSN